MSFQKFTLGLVAAFGLPWLALIVVPYAKMRDVAVVSFDEEKDGKTGVYKPVRSGRISNGSEVYGANGCYVCHSQVIRPTYAGSEIWRSDWAGQKKNADGQDTRRETNVYDYAGEKVAHIGLTRVGPDLSNVGYRLEADAKALGMTPEAYVYKRLLEPRSILTNHWSTCPSQPQLFTQPNEYAQNADVITVGEQSYLPGKYASALASYLLSLKKDDKVPTEINYARNRPVAQ